MRNKYAPKIDCQLDYGTWSDREFTACKMIDRGNYSQSIFE
ncbi:MAG: hypothetical protein QNJ41_30015 [Xenococcaceae cyanobacterium MO_188.B32]|nr:hypothetical protein [Xenococcaceae cyanobacterium MO_188.B32]